MKKDITLLDVVDRQSLQKLQDAFANATGMAALATDLEGSVTKLSNPTIFCMKLTRESKVGSQRCNQCDLQGGEQALRTGKPAVYYCHGGLVDFATPIIVGGKHIGSLIGGQVLTEPPDFDKFRKIAEEIDVDPDEYIEALKKVKIVPKEQVNSAAELLYQMANSLSAVGYEKLIVKQEKDEYKAKLEEIREYYEDIDEKMAMVVSSIDGLNKEFEVISEKTNVSVNAVEQTDSILKYIQNVATQMTLLGFNASIESKRVGAVGAGFNVIAHEVRRLAEQTSSRTNNIEDVLMDVKKSISEINNQLDITFKDLRVNIETINSLRETIAKASELISKMFQ